MAIALCRAEELPPGRSRGFDPFGIGRDTMMLVRSAQGLYGWLDACPHHGGTPMAWRKDAYLNADGSRIVCHAHGAQFELETGVCTLGPCLGQRLAPVPLMLDETGMVRLALPQPFKSAP